MVQLVNHRQLLIRARSASRQVDCFSALIDNTQQRFAKTFLARRTRSKIFNEQLELVTRLWAEERGSFDDEHYRISNLALEHTLFWSVMFVPCLRARRSFPVRQ